jgi:hypothetical protein
VSIIRSLPPLHMQPLVTVWCCVGCILQPCSVVTALVFIQFYLFCVCSGLVAKSVDASWARLVADAGTAGLAGVDCSVLYRGCHSHLDAESK